MARLCSLRAGDEETEVLMSRKRSKSSTDGEESEELADAAYKPSCPSARPQGGPSTSDFAEQNLSLDSSKAQYSASQIPIS